MKKSTWIILLALGVGATFAYNYLGSNEDSQQQYTYHKIEKSNLNITVTESGVLQAVDEVIVKNRLDGKSLILSIIA